MNIPAIRCCIAVFLFACFIAGAAVSGAHEVSDGWPVYKLPIEAGYHEGSFFDYRNLGANIAQDGRQSIHVARVMPGQSYRLGLWLRSDQAKKMTVSLFDRWPYAEGARPIQLATGGGLRGLDGKQEFQWWFSVDKKSPGSLLYIKVSADNAFGSKESDWKYRLFIVDSPRSPMNSLGRGVIYHRGPTNLKLQESSPSVVLSYQPFPIARPVRHVVGNGSWNAGQDIGEQAGTLIQNGNFIEGLAHWQLRPAKTKGVGVFDGKLRLWSQDSSEGSGIAQQVNADVSRYSALRLSIDLKISAQTESFRSSGAAPLTLSVCYEDRQGEIHCGDTAFRKHFVFRLDVAKHTPRNVVVAQPNTWSRYTFNLKELNPQPRQLISIELSGSGAPERNVWVKRIALQRN